jgi:hypothetical protein
MLKWWTGGVVFVILYYEYTISSPILKLAYKSIDPESILQLKSYILPINYFISNADDFNSNNNP